MLGSNEVSTGSKNGTRGNNSCQRGTSLQVPSIARLSCGYRQLIYQSRLRAIECGARCWASILGRQENYTKGHPDGSVK